MIPTRSDFPIARLPYYTCFRIIELNQSYSLPISCQPDDRSSAIPSRTQPTGPSLAVVLNALGDETRLSIVRQLAGGGEVACGQFDLDQPKSTSSYHFRVLISAGVIARRREGTALLNRLRRAELDGRFPGLLDAVLGGR